MKRKRETVVQTDRHPYFINKIGIHNSLGERIGVSVTLMLTVTVFMLLITEMIPESSLHIAIVEVFFVFCIDVYL